jgi:hypothetical protein
MPAPREMWEAFIEWCERAITERRASLAPLESGAMHSGRRGPDTGFQWVDTTELDAQRLRNEIASLQSTIDRNKQHLE